MGKGGVGRRFTPEELEWLQQNWQLTDAEICAHLGRSLGTIRTKRRKLGLIGKPGYRKTDWTQEELDYMQANWGEKTIPQIAKHIGRTVTAVRVKYKRMGLSGQKWYGDMMSARKVSELLGIDVHTVTDYWIPKCGLKGRKKKLAEKGSCTIIMFSDLLTWLEANQDKWDSRRVEILGLGMEYDWLQEKRKKDAALPERRAQKWTPFEDGRIISMFRRGMTYAEIATEIGDRSACAVEHRLLRLDVWGTGRYISNAEREKRRKEKRRRLEKHQRNALLVELIQLLKAHRNALAFGEFWQKDMCMLWDDVNGCTANEENCDVCKSFQRIKPQYCRRCGVSFISRKKSDMCERCKKIRKWQHRRKTAALSRNQ